MPKEMPDLSVVAERLREYDLVNDEDVATMRWDKTHDWLERIDAALIRVKEAFADATADRNPRDAAMLIHPGFSSGMGGWSSLRRWCKDQGLYYGKDT